MEARDLPWAKTAGANDGKPAVSLRSTRDVIPVEYPSPVPPQTPLSVLLLLANTGADQGTATPLVPTPAPSTPGIFDQTSIVASGNSTSSTSGSHRSQNRSNNVSASSSSSTMGPTGRRSDLVRSREGASDSLNKRQRAWVSQQPDGDGSMDMEAIAFSVCTVEDIATRLTELDYEDDLKLKREEN